MKTRTTFISGLVLAAGVLASTGALASDDWSDSPSYLPFLNSAENGERAYSPKLTLTLNQHSTEVVMDTGSTGIVVSMVDNFPDWKSIPEINDKVQAAMLPNHEDGPAVDVTKLDKISYSSSGRTMYGVYVSRPVTISGKAGPDGVVHAVTTKSIPMLAVVDVECAKHARDCAPQFKPTGIGMLGIGFARLHASDAYSTPASNPFLNIASQPDGAEAGYVISVDGVKVGIEPRDIPQSGFSLVKLKPNTQLPGEWKPLRATISIGQNAAVTGKMLMDTGIRSMFMSVPSETSAGIRKPASDAGTDSVFIGATDIGISVADTGGAVAYEFNTARTRAMAPEAVTLVGNDGSRPDWDSTFVNTGVHFLNGYNYFFDNQDGWVGFQKRVAHW